MFFERWKLEQQKNVERQKEPKKNRKEQIIIQQRT